MNYIPDSVSADASTTAGEINVAFQVAFKCNFCNDNTTLFKNPAPTRRLDIGGEEERGDAVVGTTMRRF